MIDWQPIGTFPGGDDEYLFCCLFEDGSASYHVGSPADLSDEEASQHDGFVIHNGDFYVDEVTHWAQLGPPK